MTLGQTYDKLANKVGVVTAIKLANEHRKTLEQMSRFCTGEERDYVSFLLMRVNAAITSLQGIEQGLPTPKLLTFTKALV